MWMSIPLKTVEKMDLFRSFYVFGEIEDRFWPLGMAGEKKLGKFLTGAKTPQQTRRKSLIVADSEKIIWVCPIRISKQAKVGRQTKTFLQLKITNKYQA